MSVHASNSSSPAEGLSQVLSPFAQIRLERYLFMRLARTIDDRFESLLLTGRIAKWYSQVGHEAVTVPSGLALEPGDSLCTLHRDLGAILAVYLDPARVAPDFDLGEPDDRPEPSELLYRLFCQLLGRGDGYSQGVERSFHFSFSHEAGIHHVGMISHLGAMIPVAAGCAFAHRQRGSDRVALNFIGDGGTSSGDFHEGLTLAGVWKLPLILVVENNRYAFSTPAAMQCGADRLSSKGEGYGVRAETVDGNDADEVAEAVGEAVLRARAGEGPTLIEAMIGRMRGHSEGDDSLKVVPEAELEAYLNTDPLPAYAQALRDEWILDPVVERRLEAHLEEIVEEALSRALDASPPDSGIARRPVFAPVPRPSRKEEPPEGGSSSSPSTFIDAINNALRAEMELDESVVLLGQDIGAFEGAFRATKGLYSQWPNRVLDTPMVESGAVGLAIGASLLGLKPLVEIQFSDFLTCAFTQIANVAAKMFFRCGLPCPIVLRLPSGGGVGAGPFHSQNPEGWLTHCPGLKVVCPATARDAYSLLRAAIRDPNPVMFFEPKYLYRRVKEVLPEEQPIGPLGEARIARSGTDVTIVAYGTSVWTALEVAETLRESGHELEVVDLRTLVPLDESTILDSIRKTGRAVVVHEAPLTAGFGAEIAARIASSAFPWLDAPVKRVAHEDRPSPFQRTLERELLPTEEKVVEAVRSVLQY